MRRKIISISVAAFLAFLSWAIPYYLDVNNVITQENSYWLLVISGIGAFIVICILIWGFWPRIKQVWRVLMSIRLRSPIFRQLNKKVERDEPTTLVQKENISRLLDIAEKQKENPCTHLMITDRIWFEFKRNAKRPYIWVRIYYKNLGVNDLEISFPEGFAYYRSEQLPDEIKAQEGKQNVPANGGQGIFDLYVYITPEFYKEICKELALPMRELRGLELHNVASKVYIKGDDTHCVKWSLGGKGVIFNPNPRVPYIPNSQTE